MTLVSHVDDLQRAVDEAHQAIAAAAVIIADRAITGRACLVVDADRYEAASVDLGRSLAALYDFLNPRWEHDYAVMHGLECDWCQ